MGLNLLALQDWLVWVFVGVLAVIVVGWIIFSNRRNKQRQKEYIEQLDAIQPGNKVKTAGGICGFVVEVCDDNTVIIETGSETSGKSYVKMDKELIAQTDAKGPTQIAREAAEAAKKAAKEAKLAEKETAGDKPADEKPEEQPEEKSEEKTEEKSE